MINSNTRFLGIDSTKVNLIEKKDEQNNAVAAYFTAEEIAKAVSRLQGTQYVYVAANGTDVENAAELQAAYNEAITFASEIQRATVIAAPYYYNFATDFVMDAEYVDLVSLDGNRSIILSGEGTISVTANDVFIKGVDVQTKNFTIADNLNLLKVENCAGGNNSFGSGVTVSGTFTDCVGGQYSFGGGAGGTASGLFINCKGAGYSFGGGGGTASGLFINCEENDVEGRSFGQFGIASGTFNNCNGSSQAFGGLGTASGVFNNCQGGSFAFGGSGQASGVFNNCQGGTFAFGQLLGTLRGKLYYCRLTSPGATFQTISGGGITRLCIDGNNVENNQG